MAVPNAFARLATLASCASSTVGPRRAFENLLGARAQARRQVALHGEFECFSQFGAALEAIAGVLQSPMAKKASTSLEARAKLLGRGGILLITL